MRIGLLTHGLPPRELGGAEAHSAALARALHEAGHDVHILAGSRSAGGPDEPSVDGPTVTRLPPQPAALSYRDIWDRPGFRAHLSDWLETSRPSVVHIGHPTGLSLEVGRELAAREIPYGVTLHDYWAWCGRGQMLRPDGIRCQKADAPTCAGCQGHVSRLDEQPSWAQAAGQMLPRGVLSALARQGRPGAVVPLPAGAPATARVADRIQAAHRLLAGAAFVHCPSRFMRDRVVEQFGGELELRVLAQPFRGRPVATDPGAQEGAPPLRVAFVGTLLYSKGVEVLLEAAELAGGAVAVDLIGPAALAPLGPSRASLAARAASAGARILGPRAPAAIPSLLRGYDALVLPSIWDENAPLVLREGAEAGLALVGTTVGGIPEFVRHAGGVLVEPGDPVALASALLRLASDRRALSEHRRGVPAGPGPTEVWGTLERWLVACADGRSGVG